MQANRIAIIGECMVELQKTGDATYKQSFGGDTLNTALYLSRLTHQHQITTSYVTGLGKDSFSAAMLEAWQQESINTDLVHISEKKLPGLYSISTTPDGERTFQYWRNDAAARYWLLEKDTNAVIDSLSQNQLIYLSGVSLAILPSEALDKLFTVLTACKEQGCKIAFDNNYRPALWESKDQAQQAYKTMLELTDIAFLTYDDEEMLYGDTTEQQAIDRTQALGVNEIVIKRGAEACFVITKDERIEVAPKPVSGIVDTTAAGDSFSAGYLAKRLVGGTLEESAKMGHTLAGTVICFPGAIIPSDKMPALN
ncbi:sugar kinase [Vibrio casei]|uniref:2-dehydro-3-deoxygluconokinase n=1 Tax=Vibrio casei TaxID=673372 RepID=A0A368LI32_9VIBR|nr:sugar kinase [Vibrio casei]RCS70377.1 sugar kinase [Vibrio casei]SJN20409.1 2-dehydro-3-deoxygluconate kinase [Vibrio casei]